MRKLGLALFFWVMAISTSAIAGWEPETPLPPLHRAAYDGDVVAVRRMLAAGTAVDARNDQGVTALMAAAGAGQLATISALLDAGADPNSRNIRGNTPLIFATVSSGETVNLLLGRGAAINDKGSEDRTPLDWALADENLATALSLLDHGADIKTIGRGGISFLHLAAKTGRNDLIRRFLAAGLDVNYSTFKRVTPLHFASGEGHLESVRLLLEAGAKPGPTDANGEDPIAWAAENGHTAIVQTLLNAGIDGRTATAALTAAVTKGHNDIVTLLLDRGAPIETRGFAHRPLLMLAAWSDMPDTVTLLIDRGANVNAMMGEGQKPDGETVLIQASRWMTSADPIRRLLKAGADPGAIAKDGSTTLMAACGNHKSVEPLRALLDAGIKVDASDNDGQNCFHAIGATGLLDATNLVSAKLLRVQKLVTAIDTRGYTPLHLAARYGKAAMAIRFLALGADIYARNRAGETPIYLAAENGDLATVQALLDRHADPTQENKLFKYTPLMAAADRGKAKAFAALWQSMPWLWDLRNRERRRAAGRLLERLTENKDADIADIHLLLDGYSKFLEINDLAEAMKNAAKDGRSDIVRVLAASGAPLDHPKIRSPLGTAVYGGHVETVRTLLELGAKVDFRSTDDGSRTPLMVAADKGRRELIDILLKAGAARGLKDSEGHTALDIAVTRGEVKVADALRHAGDIQTAPSRMAWRMVLNDHGLEFLGPMQGIKDAVAIADGRVFTGSRNGYFYALDAGSGAVSWKKWLAGGVERAPAADGAAVYAVTQNNTLFKLDAANGSVLWRFQYDHGGSPHTAPHLIDGGLVAFASSQRLYVIRRNDGTEAWSVEIPGAGLGPADSMTVANGKAYISLSAGGIIAVDLARRTTALYRPPAETSFSAPEIGDGTVYATARDGFLYAIDATTLRLKWRQSLGEQALVRPLFHDGILYIPSRKWLFAVKPNDKEYDIVWTHNLGVETYASPLWHDGKLYVCEGTSGLGGYALKAAISAIDPKTGNATWSHPLDSLNCVRNPVTDGVHIFAPDAGHGGEVYALSVQ
ncbi:ankyrin repeat domain-containing protein [Paramagnetospirillum magneticum]|uniref:Ankyrin repeat n=1 Tax=Paramagnetospirillum magneticum (strain ATCC 700264 / AMB-1) TaxID=342108 RepID=Q2W6M6_PARM1|nr:ankyrin repeat domain-containing protein [Paramagnetospirillum magneticum]BAE50499.1 Ankyrin repeat [Paramagnetospirillum magneticum AMB-1]